MRQSEIRSRWSDHAPAEPGGNITGVATFSPELAVKRLDLLTQAIPNVKQVAVVLDPENRLVGAVLQAVEEAAVSLVVEVQQIAVRAPKEFENALSSLAGGRVQAVCSWMMGC